MKSDIRGHFPEHIGRILEFQEIGIAGDIEIDRIWEVLAQELRNCFLDSLDEGECAARERTLSIMPLPGETLEARKRRLRGYYASGLPYTEKKLEEVLAALCGENGYELSVLRDQYRVEVRLKLAAAGLRENVTELARKMIPANMELRVSVLFNRWERFRYMRWGELKNETWGSILRDPKWQEA